MILTLNAGSSSIKFSVFEGNMRLVSGEVDRVKDYKKSLNKVVKVVKDFKIKRVAHRVVHGKNISKTLLLNKKNIERLKKIHLAPLHNPSEIKVIEESKKFFPKAKHYAVFDTAFHVTMPEVAKLYGLPYIYYLQGVKRYGFHGSSHKYIGSLVKGKVISCHLGNGCSVCAIKNGKSVDTSMGFTPLEGLVMGSRCGDIDASIVSYLMKNEGKSVNEVIKVLNSKSGLLGISGESNDVRDLLKSKSKRAKLALDLFCYRVVKYIGSYISILNGVDTIVFTAGIGENAYVLRERILKNLEYLGLNIDKVKNRKNLEVISKPDSKIKVMVVHTDEEKMMVNEVLSII